MSYSSEEYFDMILLYGECNHNAVAAAEEYRNRFPNRRHPDHHVILRLVNRARQTGSLKPTLKSIAGAPRIARDVVEEAVLEAVEEDPRRSVRFISRMCGSSKSTTQRILNSNRLHPYHYTRVQHLQEEDYPRRLRFCQWLVNKNTINHNFSQNILFTDECSFSREGMFNTHNWHFWANENPNLIRERSYQARFCVNLWAGIIGNKLIGPFELPARLNGEEYANFLMEHLPGLLEEVPLATRQTMWFQHDGAPPHNSRLARQVLQTSYPRRWIGRGGPVLWAPRSPDLTPLDFFLWNQFKDYVYREPIDTLEELEAKIHEAIATITPAMLENVQHNLIRRVNACIEANGGHFEHRI